MAQRFLVYCTGGLGNRLRPLASAMAFCRLSGRELLVYWDTVTPNGFLTPLNELFEDRFTEFTLQDFRSLKGNSLGLFTEKGAGHGAQRLASRYGRYELMQLADTNKLRQTRELGLGETSDTIVFYDNNYATGLPMELSIRFLRSLKPKKDLMRIIFDKASTMKLNPTMKGVHARGTDFGLKDPLSFYYTQISKHIRFDLYEKFWLSTEDQFLEDSLRKLFPLSVLSRDDRYFIELNPGKQVWTDPDSFSRPIDHGRDALVDLYLLSFVNLVVYHPSSTFSDVARHLHGVLEYTN